MTRYPVWDGRIPYAGMTGTHEGPYVGMEKNCPLDEKDNKRE